MHNVKYIRKWFLDRNPYLKNHEKQEEMLTALIFMVITFEKIEGISKDKIVKKGKELSFIPGPESSGDKAQKILTLVNIAYAYLDYEDLMKMHIYKGFRNYFTDGIADDEELVEWYQKDYERAVRIYKGDEKKILYKVKRNIFFADQKLTEEELKRLENVKNPDGQIHWDLYHENGKMHIW